MKIVKIDACNFENNLFDDKSIIVIFVTVITSIPKSTAFSRVTSSFNSDCEAVRISVNQVRRHFQKTLKDQEDAKSIIEKNFNSIKENARKQKKRLIKKILLRNYRKTMKKIMNDAQET